MFQTYSHQSKVKVGEKWVTIHEELGRGAFGVV